MNYNHTLHLNLFQVAGELPEIKLFRKLRQGSEKRESNESVLGAYALPPLTPNKSNDGEPWERYWISAESRDDYQSFLYNPVVNNELTKRVLFLALERSAKKMLQESEFEIYDHKFLKEVRFNIKEHTEGNEQIVVAPYFLHSQKRHGFLVEYHFQLGKGVPFNRRVQQLSLALDGQFKRNLDFLVDRLRKIRAFFESPQAKVFPLALPNEAGYVDLERDFTPISAGQLNHKTYVFGDDRKHRGQYMGLKDYGPIKKLDDKPNIVFVFVETNRGAARHLAKALTGRDPKLDFPGFSRLFESEITIDGNPIVLQNYSATEMVKAVEELRSRNHNSLPVLVMQRSEENYLCHKAIFTSHGIASQVCTVENIQDDYTLKWSIANLALQIFCKSGGRPWRVKPGDEDSLIVGISQSHKVVEIEGKKRVEKYFAFSVLTDSSGLFQEIEVLGNEVEEHTYLEAMKRNLKRLLLQNASRFSRVVLHTTFKLREREMSAIQAAVNEISQEGANNCKFIVVKINQQCRFLATNRAVNSRVPYEGSFVRLSRSEYLIWFEGIFRDKPNLSKALPGPTHIQFLRSPGSDETDHLLVLQELVDLSGANWRGFNAKSVPVSVFYCHLVAELIHDFHNLNLPLPQMKNFNPWFL